MSTDRTDQTDQTSRAGPPHPPTGVSDATLQQFVGYQLKRATNAVLGDLTQVLGQFDLRLLTFTALVLIADNPDLRPSQLARVMDIEKSNLVAVLAGLERRGLIRRHKAPADGRAVALRVTPPGARLCDQALQAVRAHEATLLAGIDVAAQATIASATARIRSNLSRRRG